MQINDASDKAIYLQVYEAIEDAIFTGGFVEETQIPSTTEISSLYRINPATVLKGMNILVNENVLYKKRGLGMFVKAGAQASIQAKRKQNFYMDYVQTMLKEAKKLNITQEQLMDMIEGGIDE